MKKSANSYVFVLLGLGTLILSAGCHKQVTAQNAMPDDPSLAPADKRAAMVKWHQEHDAKPTQAATQTQQ